MKDYLRQMQCLLLAAACCGVQPAGMCAEHVYKWVDAQGHVQYSNNMPPETALTERKEISDNGRILKVYSAPKTPEEKAEAKRLAELEAQRAERERKRAIHDHSLLATYASKEDMISVQQNKISMIEALIQLTHSRITAMRERLQKLTDEAAGFERSGKPLPFALQQQIRNLHDQIEHNTQFASDKEAEIVEVRKQYERDIIRYEELTADKTGTVKRQPSALEIAMHNPNVELTREDRTLLATFSSESDLMYARDEEMEQLDEAIRQAFTRVDELQKNLAVLTDNADEYESRGDPLPDNLVKEMKNAMEQISRAESVLADRRAAKTQAEARYTSNIDRFRVLTASTH